LQSIKPEVADPVAANPAEVVMMCGSGKGEFFLVKQETYILIILLK